MGFCYLCLLPEAPLIAWAVVFVKRFKPRGTSIAVALHQSWRAIPQKHDDQGELYRCSALAADLVAMIDTASMS